MAAKNSTASSTSIAQHVADAACRASVHGQRLAVEALRRGTASQGTFTSGRKLISMVLHALALAGLAAAARRC
jgi:hypothetical protein